MSQSRRRVKDAKKRAREPNCTGGAAPRSTLLGGRGESDGRTGCDAIENQLGPVGERAIVRLGEALQVDLRVAREPFLDERRGARLRECHAALEIRAGRFA